MRYRLAVVGVSIGGLEALKVLLGALPKDFPLPVAVVQHRQRNAVTALEELLQEVSVLTVVEGEDKTALLAGYVYIAPRDYHLLIEGDHLSLSTEAPVHYARPAIDVLFESAAEAEGERVIGIILTGDSEDGAQGLAAIKRRGGLAIVQDPESAEGRAMPEAALAAVKADHVARLEEIGPLLVRLARGTRQGA